MHNTSLGFVAPDPVALHARLHPNKLACRDLASDRRWTYSELQLDIQRAWTLFSEKGIAKGDRVAVLAKNSVFQLILQQALMRLGAIFVPLNWRLSVLELEKLLVDCAPSVFLTDGILPTVSSICRVISIQEFTKDVEAAVPGLASSSHLCNDVCVLLYTSGTSGQPKGVMLTAENLLATAINFGVLGEVDSSSVFLCDSPMFHVIGLVTQIWPPLMMGGSVLVSPGFVPDSTNSRLGDPELAVTHYFCVPQMAEALCHAPNFEPSKWRNLKALFTGGAPTPPARIHWWLDHGVCMVDGFGMTETSTVLGMPLSRKTLRSKAGSVGVAGPVTTVRIVDECDCDVPDGIPGEILVSGLNVTPGYWNRQQETEDAFTADGWLRTGDIARRDEDGFVFIIDRRKDIFISGGENVHPAEVEAALATYPGVKEVAVVGVPSPRWGEVGCAFLVPSTGALPKDEDLSQHCQQTIAKYKVPKMYVCVESIPRTGSGKVLKHVLRSQARSR